MIQQNLFRLVAILLAATCFIAEAQTSIAQLFPQAPTNQRNQQRRLQLQQIQTQTEAEIEKLLTPEQQVLFRQARRRGSNILDSVDSIENLSPSQRSKINTIVRNTSQRILELNRQRQS
jgi:hypothetical protein